MVENKNNIYLWTGEGAGKTTSALGVALRCAGHKQKVIVIQFMKGRKNIGEYKIASKLKPYYEIHQFGKRGWVDLKNPSKADYEWAEKGLKFAYSAAKKRPRVLVLDEINLACAIGLLDVRKVVELAEHCSKYTIVYMTGRFAPRELIDAADFVNRIEEVKKPKSYPARRGIEY